MLHAEFSVAGAARNCATTIVDWVKFINLADREHAERPMDDLRKAGLPG